MASTNKAILSAARSIVPSLTAAMHKGQAGRIVVVGGSKKYTGAPYYAGISALKTGADLLTLFCTEEAAVPIKAYSPELMVNPLLISSATVAKHPSVSFDKLMEPVIAEVKETLKSTHAVVLGPGLGRDEATLSCAAKVIATAKEQNVPIVIDGDGLFLLSQHPELVQGYHSAILTPNAMEFKRLWDAMSSSNKGGDNEKLLDIHSETQFIADLEAPKPEEVAKLHTAKLAKMLGGVTICRKGEVDIVSNGIEAAVCTATGNPRRCGGQGDVLAGTTGLFLAWAMAALKAQKAKNPEASAISGFAPTVLASWSACFLTRSAGQAAFRKHYRSTLTTDVIPELGAAMQCHFPVQLDQALVSPAARL